MPDVLDMNEHTKRNTNYNSIKNVATTLATGLGASYMASSILGKLAATTLDHQVHRFDKKVSTGLRDKANPVLDPIMRIMSVAGEPWTLYPVMSIVALRWLTEQRKADSAALVLALTGSAAIDKLIKVSIRRPRPRFMLHRSK